MKCNDLILIYYQKYLSNAIKQYNIYIFNLNT